MEATSPGGVRKPTVISPVSASGIHVKPSFGTIANAPTIEAVATLTTTHRWLIAHLSALRDSGQPRARTTR